MHINDYDYELPDELIARYPSVNKTDAKLLVYDRVSKNITHSTFANLLEFIPQKSNFIFNDTKVIKARLFGCKNTKDGAKIELLINKYIKQNTFTVFIKGRVKVSTKIIFDNDLIAKVISLNLDGSRKVQFYQNDKILDFESLLLIIEKIGNIPIPPYLKREAISSDYTNYQSIFAKYDGSVASPTASLHFDEELITKIKKYHNINFITLHIGAGTFKSVEADNIKEHIMHEEFYSIPQQTQELINSNKHLIAVGTTACRSIESYIRSYKDSDETKLFLNLENKPKRVDSLITNFHFPKSTLLMLVSSFIGLDETKRIYQEAIKEKYKFYSYGDGMLIL